MSIQINLLFINACNGNNCVRTVTWTNTSGLCHNYLTNKSRKDGKQTKELSFLVCARKLHFDKCTILGIVKQIRANLLSSCNIFFFREAKIFSYLFFLSKRLSGKPSTIRNSDLIFSLCSRKRPKLSEYKFLSHFDPGPEPNIPTIPDHFRPRWKTN